MTRHGTSAPTPAAPVPTAPAARATDTAPVIGDGRVPSASDDTVVAAFLDALARRDAAALQACLAPDVWLRALLTRTVFEATDAAGVVAAYRGWLGAQDGLTVLVAEHRGLIGRHLLRYRFLLRPDWAPETWHEIEQTGYCRVRDGRISRIDLACTGYWPVADVRPR